MRRLLDQPDALAFKIDRPRHPGLGFAQPDGLRLAIKVPRFQPRQFGIARAGKQGRLPPKGEMPDRRH